MVGKYPNQAVCRLVAGQGRTLGTRLLKRPWRRPNKFPFIVGIKFNLGFKNPYET